MPISLALLKNEYEFWQAPSPRENYFSHYELTIHNNKQNYSFKKMYDPEHKPSNLATKSFSL